MSVCGATKWRSVLHCAISCSTLCEATGQLEGEAAGQLEGEATGQLEGAAGTGLSKVDCTSAFQAFFFLSFFVVASVLTSSSTQVRFVSVLLKLQLSFSIFFNFSQ